MVMGDDSCSRGCGFESRCCILHGHGIFHIDLLQELICLFEKTENKQIKMSGLAILKTTTLINHRLVFKQLFFSVHKSISNSTTRHLLKMFLMFWLDTREFELQKLKSDQIEHKKSDPLDWLKRKLLFSQEFHWN